MPEENCARRPYAVEEISKEAIVSESLPRIVGVGPVLAGWRPPEYHDPIYYIDVLLEDGSTRRITFDKRRRGADRPAKVSALRERMLIAAAHRPDVVLAHDAASFKGLVAWVARLRAEKPAPSPC